MRTMVCCTETRGANQQLAAYGCPQLRRPERVPSCRALCSALLGAPGHGHGALDRRARPRNGRRVMFTLGLLLVARVSAVVLTVATLCLVRQAI